MSQSFFFLATPFLSFGSCWTSQAGQFLNSEFSVILLRSRILDVKQILPTYLDLRDIKRLFKSLNQRLKYCHPLPLPLNNGKGWP